MFQFTEDCIIGVDQIDEEHRYLFELINQGMEMVENPHAEELDVEDQYEKIKALQKELVDYADQHFAHEEAYMEKIRDPELIVQRVQHKAFRKNIQEWLLTDLTDAAQQRKLLKEMLDYLARWLYHHILGSDVMIGKFPPLEEWVLKENPCRFTKEYYTGIQFIDQEHEKLFQIVEKANQLIHDQFIYDEFDELTGVIQELRDYTKHHFQDEESYMELIQYEGLPAQKRAHEAFIDKLENIDLQGAEENPKAYLENLIEILLGWLINHILHVDKKIPNITIDLDDGRAK